ncbi:hypothetical protein HDU93_001562, partial [Gonapodya sp. JEL0774]
KKDGRTAPASLWLKERWVDINVNGEALSGDDRAKERIYMWVFEEIKENKVTLVVTSQGKILSSAGASEEIFGYTDEELPLKRLYDLIPALRPGPGTPGTPLTPSTYFHIQTPPVVGNGGPFSLDVVEKLKFFGAVTRQGLTVPVIAKVLDDVAANDMDADPLTPNFAPIPSGSSRIEIISMPNIAGVITANGETGIIESCNTVFAKYLFGISSKELVGKANIIQLLPQFWTLVQRMAQGSGAGESGPLSDSNGHVTTIRSAFSKDYPESAAGTPLSYVPNPFNGSTSSLQYDGFSATSTPAEHTSYSSLTEHPAVKTTGVIAYHRDGTPFNVDVQIRSVRERSSNGSLKDGVQTRNGVTFALWITYDRFVANKVAVIVRHAMEQERVKEEGQLHGDQDAHRGSRVAELKVSDSPALVRRSSLRSSDSKKRMTILDYEVQETIGEGAYGFVKHVIRIDDPSKVNWQSIGQRNVFDSSDTETTFVIQKVYVLKYVIKTRILVDTWAKDRELGIVPQEIHVLNYLRKHPHPCICRMTEYFEDDEYYYIEMARHGVGMDL